MLKQKDIWLYVDIDDIIYIRSSLSLILKFKTSLMAEFYISDLRLLNLFLILQIIHNDYSLFISQDKYVCDLLMNFNMFCHKTRSTPMNYQWQIMHWWWDWINK